MAYVEDINSEPYYPFGVSYKELENYSWYCKNWNVFISPEGMIYKISEFDSFSTGHDSFAYNHGKDVFRKDITKEYDKLRKIKPHLANLAPKDILINLYGYVSFEQEVIMLPDPSYHNENVTDAQMLAILKLCKLNGISDSKRKELFRAGMPNNMSEKIIK